MRSVSTFVVDSDTESICFDVSTISDLSSDLHVELARTAKMEEGEIEDKESPEWEIEAVGIERQIPKRKRKHTLTFTNDDDGEDTKTDGFGSAYADLSETPPLMSKQQTKQTTVHKNNNKHFQILMHFTRKNSDRKLAKCIQEHHPFPFT